jgi:hypothetical protein
MQRQRRLPALAILAGLGLASAAVPAGAQPAPFTEEPTQYRSNKPYQSEVDRQKRREEQEAGISHSPWVVVGGVDMRNQYFFRGYNYVSSGFIAQPYVQVGYHVYSDENVSVTPHGGGWLDLTEQETPDPPVHIREFRGNVGAVVDVRDWRFDFQYVYYSSPGNAFRESQEVGVDVGYDDRHFWEGRSNCFAAVNPSFSLYREIEDSRDHDLNTYVGVGIEPTLRPYDIGPFPVTFSFPVTLGGSYDGYYKDASGRNSNFGYWSVGLRAAMPLGRTAYGLRWFLDAEVDYLQLMAKSVRAANGFDDSDAVFRVGLSFR